MWNTARRPRPAQPSGLALLFSRVLESPSFLLVPSLRRRSRPARPACPRNAFTARQPVPRCGRFCLERPKSRPGPSSRFAGVFEKAAVLPVFRQCGAPRLPAGSVAGFGRVRAGASRPAAPATPLTLYRKGGNTVSRRRLCPCSPSRRRRSLPCRSIPYRKRSTPSGGICPCAPSLPDAVRGRLSVAPDQGSPRRLAISTRPVRQHFFDCLRSPLISSFQKERGVRRVQRDNFCLCRVGGWLWYFRRPFSGSARKVTSSHPRPTPAEVLPVPAGFVQSGAMG